MQIKDNEIFIGDIPVGEIARTYGTPTYVYDENRIRENYRKVLRTFQKYYADFRLFYAIKGNDNLAIASLICQEGAGIDAASVNEILLAKDSLDQAIAAYKQVSDINSSYLVSQWLIIRNLGASDVLPRAYIKKGVPDSAISEYERMITFDPTSKKRQLVNPKHYYHLAKLYQQTGKRQKAIERYKRFLDIWKYADKGLPEKVDAEKRLAALVEGKR